MEATDTRAASASTARRRVPPAGIGGAAGLGVAALDVGDVSWDGYCTARLLTLAEPLGLREEGLVRHAAAALERYLGLAPATAVGQARRAVLLSRDRLLHDLLLRQAAPSLLAAVVDRVAVEGLEHLRGLSRARGVLLVTLHYSLYPSILWLWLARATACGLFTHLTSLMIASAAGAPEVVARRMAQLETAGLLRCATTTVLDRGRGFGSNAAGRLAAALRAGGAVLVAPDGQFLPASEPRAIPLTLGCRPVRLPRGVAWLARATGCAVVPVHIRPHEDGHTVIFGPPAPPITPETALGAVQATLQSLVDRAVVVDPAPWDEWWRVDWERARIPGAARSLEDLARPPLVGRPEGE